MPAKIVNARPAGEGHEVLTVVEGKGSFRREPCKTCPWRTDAVGEFPAEAFREAANTAYDIADKTFGCHTSGSAKPAICAGFLLRNADNNMQVRLLQMQGRLDIQKVHDGGVDLFDSYRTMAVANGVDPGDPVLAQCRANDA